MIILKYILVSILISIIFGLTVLSQKIVSKFINSYLFQTWSLLIFIPFWFFNKSKIEIFEVSKLANLNNIVLILIAVIPTSFIVYFGNPIKPRKTFGIVDCISGASMEIPQRLLVQNVFIILNLNTIIYGSLTLAIPLNALIWVQFIIVQEFINGRKLSMKILHEIIASTWFSIWVGILYSISGNIILAMIAHSCQRMITYWLKNNFSKANSSLST